MKTKILKIEEIEIERSLYPRVESNFETIERYSKAMKVGTKFPMIVVAWFEGRYLLVDGKHRLDAYELNGEKHIGVEVLENLSKKEIYIESVKRNIIHGQPFIEEDIDKIKVSLGDLKLSEEEISEIIRVPVDEIKPVVASKLDELVPKKVFEKEKIKPEHLINTRNKEIRERNEQERLKNYYSPEHFVTYLYTFSRKVEDFSSKLENYEKLRNRDNLREVNGALEKIEEGKKMLDKVKKILLEMSKEKEEEEEPELEHFDEERVDEFFEDSYGETDE